MWNMHCFPRNLQGLLGVPYANLVHSVQLFTTSLVLERNQYYRQPVLHQVPGGSLGGPWELPGNPWRLPGRSLGDSLRFGPWGGPGDPQSSPGCSLIQTLFSQFSCSKHGWGSHLFAIPCDSALRIRKISIDYLNFSRIL